MNSTLCARPECAIRLDRGDPVDHTPPEIAQAGIDAIRAGRTHYTSPEGTLGFRRAAAAVLLREVGVAYDPDTEILATAGATTGIFTVMSSITTQRDVVLVANPGWPAYVRMLAHLGISAREYHLPSWPLPVEPSKWAAHLRSLLDDGVRLMVLNSPHNPTGTVLQDEYSVVLREICDTYPRLLILSDEAYCHLLYDGRRHLSPASHGSMRGRTIIVRTCSKSYCMTGWRVAFMAGPAEVIAGIKSTHLAINCCASSIAQEAAQWAMENGDSILAAARSTYQTNRDDLVQQLTGIPGVKCPRPDGTFYVFPNISCLGPTSQAVVEELQQRENVFIYPGNNYGTRGEGYVRICFAAKPATLEDLVLRLRRYASGKMTSNEHPRDNHVKH